MKENLYQLMKDRYVFMKIKFSLTISSISPLGALEYYHTLQYTGPRSSFKLAVTFIKG